MSIRAHARGDNLRNSLARSIQFKIPPSRSSLAQPPPRTSRRRVPACIIMRRAYISSRALIYRYVLTIVFQRHNVSQDYVCIFRCMHIRSGTEKKVAVVSVVRHLKMLCNWPQLCKNVRCNPRNHDVWVSVLPTNSLYVFLQHETKRY